MRTVILVPRRPHPDRDNLWAWCKDRWEAILPDVPIYEGLHLDGPFNRSAAINTAARLAGQWDLAVVIDADIFIRASQIKNAIQTAGRTGKVTWAHRRWRGLHEDHTKRVIHQSRAIDFGPEIAGHDMDILVERTNPYSWSCCIVIPRPVWDDMGGFDERFVGWGFEDMAFKSLVCGLYGWNRIDGDVYHLWHPRSEERIVRGRPAETASPEYLTNARLGRRYMAAQYREHGLGDEGELLSDEVRARHVANLRLDDAKLVEYARRYGLPDWSAWWPTLEELRDGWKNGPPPTVTVVVHTGGEPAMWPERSEYLRQSLASLTENVTGPIIQRVIYSDWGPDNLDEIKAIGTPHGFYVAGQGHHGYTVSMQRMWHYLGKRAKGEFIFSAEDDFIYTKPVDLEPMIDTLLAAPHLRQLALLRAPFYPRELKAGSVIASLKDTFRTVSDNGHSRVEHRDHWTANPSLFRRSLTGTQWPNGESSERLFGDLLNRDKASRFAYWGDGEPWIEHVGTVRAGSGY